MKKALLILFTILYILGISTNVMAAADVRLSDENGVQLDGRLFNTLTIDNPGTGWLETGVSTSTIVPGSQKILGWAIMELSHGISVGNPAEMVIALHDSSSLAAGVPTANMIDEAEVEDDKQSKAVFWPHARKIQTQLRIVQGSNTRVLIYYVE